MLSNFLMTQSPNQRPLHPSLQAKLQLLENLQNGNLERVRELAYALSKVGRTNPQLYGKLSAFVEQHKEQLNDSDSEDGDNEPQIVSIDESFVQGKQWDSDQSVDWESDNEQDDGKENKTMKQVKKETLPKNSPKKQLFKELKSNSDKRSVSNKKITASTPNNTHQFKPSVVRKQVQAKQSSKTQVHKNSAIGKSKNSAQN